MTDLTAVPPGAAPAGTTSPAGEPIVQIPPTPSPAPTPGTGAREFEVVPRRGLVAVAAVVAGLIAAIVTNRLWALDFFHVVGGSMWTTLDLFLGFLLGPILGRLSVPARIELTRRLMPKMVLLMPTLVTCTLAGGWQLARHLGTIETTYPEHGWVVVSMIVVAVIAVVALGVLEPANISVLIELKKPAPNGAVIERLMRRFIVTAGITGAMQVATLVIMTKLATA